LQLLIAHPLGGATFFTKFDFRDGYHNLRMHPDSIEKTAFKCKYGLFEYTVMPFGLTNAPAAFSAMMNRIFGDLYDISAIVYLDDIVIFSKTLQEHQFHVEEVLKRMRHEQLHVKLSKCTFSASSVDFCGHTISGEGISVSENKIIALQAHGTEFKSRKDVEKFLGVVVWFQDFILNYATITRPLTDLLRKDKTFIWDTGAAKAVETIISKICEAPVLRHFDASLPTRLYTDASQWAIGGWIAQKHTDGWHPVVFVSRKLKEEKFTTPTLSANY
jgi:hypothetical protein